MVIHRSINTEFKKGHIQPIETRNKLRIAHLGKKLSDETKQKMSEKAKGNSHGFKKGYTPWRYIDGRSKLVGPGRYGSEWSNIRKAVLIRDNFTCQECNITNVKFDIHHKIPFLLTKDNSLNNLITLCDICHKKLENKINRELKNQEETL